VNQTLDSLIQISDDDKDGFLTKNQCMILLTGIVKLSLEIEMKNRGKLS